MKITHIHSIDSSVDLWQLSKGNRILYRGKASPWQSPNVIAAALKQEGKQEGKREGKLFRLIA